jgi:DNA-binding transcriptional LysR family regulator
MREEVEAAFVAEPYPAAGLECVVAFQEELVLITPKSTPRIRSPKDIGSRPVLAFATGCSYPSAAGSLARPRQEYGSYHAIVACTAAGSGIAIVPKSVLRTVGAEDQVLVHPLPANVAAAKTRLVWRKGHQSGTLDALRRQLQLKD